MINRPKILVLATGGTLAAQAGENGLSPAHGIQDLIDQLPNLQQHYEVECVDLLRLDSSNIQPENWITMATYIAQTHSRFDGIVLTHGTDTMAYTAAMLSYMLIGIPIPVVLTGSQLPMDHPLSDAPANLSLAFEMATSKKAGVFVAFNRHIILGTRAVKTHTIDFAAFESINYPYVGELSADGLILDEKQIPPVKEHALQLKTDLVSDIFLLKLIPGLSPNFFEQLIQMNYKGMVIEAFGIGGLHCLHRDHVSALDQIIRSNIPIVITSQCLYERSDFSRYETGRLLKQKGAIEAFDMTSEAAVTKLMWLLGHCMTYEAVVKGFATNYCGEIYISHP